MKRFNGKLGYLGIESSFIYDTSEWKINEIRMSLDPLSDEEKVFKVLSYIGDESEPIRIPVGCNSCAFMFKRYKFKKRDSLLGFNSFTCKDFTGMFSGCSFPDSFICDVETRGATSMVDMFCNAKLGRDFMFTDRFAVPKECDSECMSGELAMFSESSLIYRDYFVGMLNSDAVKYIKDCKIKVKIYEALLQSVFRNGNVDNYCEAILWAVKVNEDEELDSDIVMSAVSLVNGILVKQCDESIQRCLSVGNEKSAYNIKETVEYLVKFRKFPKELVYERVCKFIEDQYVVR